MIVNVEFFHVYFPAMSENNNVKMKRVGYEGGAEGLRPVKECGEDVPRPCKEPKMTCVEPRSGNGKTFNKSDPSKGGSQNKPVFYKIFSPLSPVPDIATVSSPHLGLPSPLPVELGGGGFDPALFYNQQSVHLIQENGSVFQQPDGTLLPQGGVFQGLDGMYQGSGAVPVINNQVFQFPQNHFDSGAPLFLFDPSVPPPSLAPIPLTPTIIAPATPTPTLVAPATPNLIAPANSNLGAATPDPAFVYSGAESYTPALYQPQPYSNQQAAMYVSYSPYQTPDQPYQMQNQPYLMQNQPYLMQNQPYQIQNQPYRMAATPGQGYQIVDQQAPPGCPVQYVTTPTVSPYQGSESTDSGLTSEMSNLSLGDSGNTGGGRTPANSPTDEGGSISSGRATSSPPLVPLGCSSKLTKLRVKNQRKNKPEKDSVRIGDETPDIVKSVELKLEACDAGIIQTRPGEASYWGAGSGVMYPQSYTTGYQYSQYQPYGMDQSQQQYNGSQWYNSPAQYSMYGCSAPYSMYNSPAQYSMYNNTAPYTTPLGNAVETSYNNQFLQYQYPADPQFNNQFY